MEWHDIEIDGRHTVKFTDLPYVPLARPPQSPDADEFFIGQKLGGIIRHGEWAWLARNSVLQIVSLRNGQTISSYEFCESRGYKNCYIKCVEEIFPNNPEFMLLAVVLESINGQGDSGSIVALYSTELSSVLNKIELSLHITCACFMNSSTCRHSLFQNFDGCLAVGSEEGFIILLDLAIHKLISMNNELCEENVIPCHIVDHSLPLTDIHRNFRQCQEDGIHFGLQIEVIESPCPIQCILPIDLILGLAFGVEDGRMALFDLTELEIFYVALPTQDVTMSALVKMDFLVPPDDPRPCLYIWALHENGENLHAVLHSLMYKKRVMEEDETSTYFKSFQTSSVRLQLPLEATKSVALSCQAISTLSGNGEDDSNCLCVISWLSVLESKNKLLIFDLNQWYKEEMPFVLEYNKQPNYLAGYILNGECTGLHALLNPDNIAPFNSVQRFEEHFYPNSLSFECSLVHIAGCRRYNWEGAQNRVINQLRSSNAAIFLEPNFYFNEILRTRLMPQFIDLNMNATFSRNSKYEILLSAALEHNCTSLLRDCAKSWIDGSFMGNFSSSTGLSLSTLTDWLWKRATNIKTRCNDLCKSQFEVNSIYPLDNREQKELGFITRQLKLLSDLLKDILVYAKKQIPERAYHDLENKYSSLCMASSYQDILLWLINIDLLPEARPSNDGHNVHYERTPYPYKELKEFYRNKRSVFAKTNESLITKKSQSCKLLFIDAFIEQACKGNILYEYWLENEGDGLYPPNSLEAMLRVMLVPDLDYDNKCAILLYFFLDLNMTIDKDAHQEVVANFIKFPSVFKLSAALIKTVQAFWNLDHDQYLPAVEEFISPFNKNQCYSQWQVELFIEVLLNQKLNNLALRILDAQPSLISNLLKLKTLLSNELLSEAFHFVRSKNDDSLLETFFSCCLCNGQFGVIRDLALSESEGLILRNILKKSKAKEAESLHFVYLLQKSKYIEAVSYMEELANKPKTIKHQASQVDTPNLVLSAFNTTMTPVTQGLTDVYFRIKNKIKKKEVNNKSPVPLSCQLIKQNANSLLGGIYHSSALSAHFATYYWGEMDEKTEQAKHLLNSNNAPFLRRPQIDTNCIDYLAKNSVSYPQVYKASEKRTLVEAEVLDDNDFKRQKFENKSNPKKKRRLVGQEIIDDLSHFMKLNKTATSLNATEFNFGPEQTDQASDQTRKNSLDILTRPLITKPTNGSGQDDAENVTKVPEIHGILKTHTPEPGHLQREPTIEEEKNLRFRLPSANVSTTQIHTDVSQNECAVEAMIVGETEEEENESSFNSLTASTKLKQITRAVSEESNKSFDSSSSQSEENFYSPLCSQNNSKLDSSNLSKHSVMSGPQPRKPLARLSSERSEKSLTPEPETKTTDLTVSSKSSNFAYTTALESSIRPRISPRRSIETQSTCTSEQLQKSTLKEQSVQKDSTNLAYVTAVETLSKPQSFDFLKSNPKIAQKTCGFGGRMSQITFVGSNISEFEPKVSSSKVGTHPLNTTEPCSPNKLSECSTVAGSLTTFECSNATDSNNVFAMPNMPIETKGQLLVTDKPTEDEKRQMLETTLGMSSYDFSILDSTTSVQQTKSFIMTTAKDESFKLVATTADEVKNTEIAAKDDDEQMKNEEQDEQMGEEECATEIKNTTNAVDDKEDSNNEPKEEKEEYMIEAQKTISTANYKEDSNDCIVLSSSSSSSPSSSPSSLPEDDDEYSNIETGQSVMDNGENEDYENFEMQEYFERDDNNEEKSMEEIDYPSETVKEDLIQLIEDTSSEMSQEETHYDAESDSDDVEFVEDQQPLQTAEITAKCEEKLTAMKEVNEDKVNIGDSNIFQNKNAAVDDVELLDKNNVEVVDAIIKKPSAPLEKKSVEETENLDEHINIPDLSAAEELKKYSPTLKNPSDIDIQINENILESKISKDCEKLSPTSNEVTAQTDSDLITKSDDAPHTETVDTEDNLHGSQEQQKQNEIGNKTQEDAQISVVTVHETKGDFSENMETKILNLVAISDVTEEEPMALQMEESLDGAEVQEQFENEKSTIKIEEKSEVLGEVVSENIKTDTKKSLKDEDVKEIETSMPHKRKIEEKSEVVGVVEKLSENIQTDIKKSLKDKDDEEIETSMPHKRKIEEKSEMVGGEVEKLSEHIETDIKKSFKDEDVKETEISKSHKRKIEEKSELVGGEVEKLSEHIETDIKKSFKDEDVKETDISKSHKRKIEQISSAEVGEVEKQSENIQTDIKKSLKDKDVKEIETSMPHKRRTLRGSSVPPIEPEIDIFAAVASPRRSTRGISVPPQTISESEEFSNVTPRARRRVRASSLQPKSKVDDNETETPSKWYKLQGPESSEATLRTLRDSSVPTGTVTGKISTRRKSVLLDAINEDPATLDSPSTRTRLRSRLNSMDSELDSSIVSANDQLAPQPKRTRKTSISSNPSELSSTPKRIRRNSISSQPETSAVITPRALRGRSILSVQEEDSESIPPSPNSTTNKRIGLKRKKSTAEESRSESQEQIDQISPKSDISSALDVSYSSSRRLTRTQLAIMEKSASFLSSSTQEPVDKETIKISPPSNKRATKPHAIRASNAQVDTDDVESVSSKLSTASSITGTKRRVTRSSLKQQDDVDDGASVISSDGSEIHLRGRRSKEKSSSNATLAAIPEDSPVVEHKKRGRSAKH